jgi:NAD(P)-dependent dehydrogenase (short-subunit alcohol dehydrogenase family)
VGFPLLGVYSATKAGVVRMTGAMALERAIRACAPTRSAPGS